jgi:mRNA-degrading endonuclease RelE of RelBE toxin-antitoxin system
MSESKTTRPWTVEYSAKAAKQKMKLPESLTSRLLDLTWDLEHKGPVQREWSHYSPLGKAKGVPGDSHHCHIKNGRPTYVVCWQVVNKKIKIIEIFYVGTHENAPY